MDVAENIVAVCKRCHERHENAVERLPFEAVEVAVVLVADGRMTSYLERTYGFEAWDA